MTWYLYITLIYRLPIVFKHIILPYAYVYMCTRVCLHIHVCTDVCVCVTVGVHIHSCTCIHRQRPSLGITFQGCLPRPLKQGLSLALNLVIRLPWPISLCFPSDEITPPLYGFWDYDSHICTASTLPTDFSPQVCNSWLQFKEYVCGYQYQYQWLSSSLVWQRYKPWGLSYIRSNNYMIAFKSILNCPTLWNKMWFNIYTLNLTCTKYPKNIKNI